MVFNDQHQASLSLEEVQTTPHALLTTELRATIAANPIIVAILARASELKANHYAVVNRKNLLSTLG